MISVIIIDITIMIITTMIIMIAILGKWKWSSNQISWEDQVVGGSTLCGGNPLGRNCPPAWASSWWSWSLSWLIWVIMIMVVFWRWCWWWWWWWWSWSWWWQLWGWVCLRNENQFKSLVIRPVLCQAGAWCYFRHVDNVQKWKCFWPLLNGTRWWWYWPPTNTCGVKRPDIYMIWWGWYESTGQYDNMIIWSWHDTMMTIWRHDHMMMIWWRWHEDMINDMTTWWWDWPMVPPPRHFWSWPTSKYCTGQRQFLGDKTWINYSSKTFPRCQNNNNTTTITIPRWQNIDQHITFIIVLL